MKYPKEQIEKVLVENWVEIARQFQETQSDILTTLYQRYSDLEKANIVLYFACAVHEAVLNLRKVNLQADISYQNFWHNHESLKAIHHKIIKIANRGFPLSGLVAVPTINAARNIAAPTAPIETRTPLKPTRYW